MNGSSINIVNNNRSHGNRFFRKIVRIVSLATVVALTLIACCKYQSVKLDDSYLSSLDVVKNITTIHSANSIVNDSSYDARWERTPIERITRTPVKRIQIENYRKGTALMLNIHVTHHGGTNFCTKIGRHGGVAPDFACLGDRNNVMPDPPPCNKKNDDDLFCNSYSEMNEKKVPWTKIETGPFVAALRPYFHMISWEFSDTGFLHKYGRNLNDPDWTHPNLVSVIITRDPLSRLLSGDGHVLHKYPGYNKKGLSRKKWWDYAAYENDKGTDNFFLRLLVDEDRTNNESKNHIEEGMNRTTDEIMELFPTGITQEHYEHGKSLLDKFTVVLDIACLDEGIEALARLLHINIYQNETTTELMKKKHVHHRETPKERIKYNDVYDYLLAKNRWDIALYEYSKSISLVNCEDLSIVSNQTTTRIR